MSSKCDLSSFFPIHAVFCAVEHGLIARHNDPFSVLAYWV